ncbi:MAG TPA: hypothetical protein VGE55_01900 [Limnobacter sp.]|uniref:hypothetical protein n=1 Tax=Limnobacter sp. TaxID=2003368 RepID=UPI002ED86D69
MEELKNTLANYSALIMALSVLGAILAALTKSSVRFRLMDFWVQFPLLGTIARLAKDTTDANNGWRRAEEKLCAKYKSYVSMVSRETFRERIEYLKNAGDLGRTPTPTFVWMLLVVLLLAEAFGFSFMLAGWMDGGKGTANTQFVLALAIVLVLAILLLALTHSAGHEYFRTSLLRSSFKTFKNNGGKSYFTQLVSLQDRQAVDMADPPSVRTANRVASNANDRGGYTTVIITATVVALIAIVSTWMRVENLNSTLIQETLGHSGGNSTQQDNPFNEKTGLPSEITQGQAAVESQAAKEIDSSHFSEGLAAFIMLGAIFVVTQVVGIGAGYRFGFAGRESKKAFFEVYGCSTFEEYMNLVRPIRDIANARLKDLQQRLEETSGQQLKLTKTFDDYLTRDLSQELEMHQKSSAEVLKSATASAAPTVDDVKAQMIALNDPEKEKQAFLQLPPALQSNVDLQSWLKQRKLDRSTPKVAMDDLF